MIPDVLASARRVVVKTGSALVTDADTGRPRTGWLHRFADSIARLRVRDQQVILVSSGAIALGRRALGKPTGALRLDEKQASAALGQIRLMQALEAAFAFHDIPIAQSLLTLDDTEQRKRWLNARGTLDTLLECGALPVINENDTVATSEIRYGDNDRLAARVAQMLGADLLVLLSDVDGLYTADPSTDDSARHIPLVNTLTEDLRASAGSANTQRGVGSGGMATKLAAVDIAREAGCSVIIARGDSPNPIGDLEDQSARGTLFPASTTPRKARASWLAGHLAPEGRLTVDEGAANALLNGNSLLPVGVQSVHGQFARGAAVEVCRMDGSVMGLGVTAYASEEALAIAGLRSDDIEHRLGYRGRRALIHRDDLVLKESNHEC